MILWILSGIVAVLCVAAVFYSTDKDDDQGGD